MPPKLIFLLYVLPLLNVTVLLTVNKKVKLRLVILMVTLVFNIAGLGMLYGGSLADGKTRGRETGILTFFSLVELLLFVRWSKRPGMKQKEDAPNH